MKDLGRLAILTVSALLSLSGCIVTPDRPHDVVEYRYENGDRIDSHGHRDVHWCDSHHDDEHCH
jgi:hypothetical protein